VPFFLHGGTAAVGGRGEVVKELPDIAPLDLTLFVPGTRIEGKTAAAYAALTPSDFTDSTRTRAAIEALRRGASLRTEHLFNAFDRQVGDVLPALGRAMRVCRQSNVATITCGSGPAFFTLTHRDDLPEHLLAELERECDVRAIASRSLSRAESLAVKES
jgi:4-diphosphocytidyl-2C-methyl-D-erythritol kinase